MEGTALDLNWEKYSSCIKIMTYHMPLWHSDLALNGRPEQHRKPGHRFCLQCNDKIKR